MGNINYRTLVVRFWDWGYGKEEEQAKAARDAILAVFAKHLGDEMASKVVGPVANFPVNGGAMLMVSPTGSKNGWAPHQLWREAFEEFKQTLGSDCVWALVAMGGDDDDVSVIES